MNGPNNKIGWCDYTWNAITGCTGDGISQCYKYCYARIMYERFGWSFKPTFHLKRLDEPYKVKEPSIIFVSSVSDFFAESTKKEWQKQVLNVVENNPQHIFLFLTKQSYNIPKDYRFTDNVGIGVTVTKQEERFRLKDLMEVKCKLKFVSFEPLKQNLGYDIDWLDWVIVGALTGKGAKPINRNNVMSIIKYCILNKIPVYIKDNVKFYQEFKEFPETLKNRF